MKYGFEVLIFPKELNVSVILMEDAHGRYEGEVLKFKWDYDQIANRYDCFEILMPRFNYCTLRTSASLLLRLDTFFDEGSYSKPTDILEWLATRRNTERVWYDPRINRHATRAELKPAEWQVWGDDVYYCRVTALDIITAREQIHTKMQNGAGNELYAKWVAGGCKVSLEKYQPNPTFDFREIQELLDK